MRGLERFVQTSANQEHSRRREISQRFRRRVRKQKARTALVSYRPVEVNGSSTEHQAGVTNLTRSPTRTLPYFTTQP